MLGGSPVWCALRLLAGDAVYVAVELAGVAGFAGVQGKVREAILTASGA